jgi:uncharacterized protein (DUF1684 family)
MNGNSSTENAQRINESNSEKQARRRFTGLFPNDNEAARISVEFKPNPATHTLQLPPNTEIILYNIQGAIVLKSAEIHISVVHLPRGVYGYRLVSRTGIHTTAGKIILE